jgi:uncharacterized protein
MGKKAKAARRAAAAHGEPRSTALVAVPQPKRTLARADPEMMAALLAAQETKPDISPWAVAEPAPGVVPQGAAVMAQDDQLTSLYAFAQSGFYGEGLRWPGYPYLAELAQRPEYRRISETIAREMTRKWITLTAVGDDDKTKEIARLEAAFKKYHVQDLFRRASELDGFFGRAQIYIDTGASDDPDELKTILRRNKAKIGKGRLRGLRVIEPIWSYPTGYNADDPLREDYYRPKSWYIRGREVHTSRLLTFVSREVPDLLKPAYSFGGLSMSQMAQPYVENWLRTRQSVSDLLHSFSVSVLSTNMAATYAENGTTGLINRAKMFNMLRDNRSLMMLDKEQEEFANVSAPLGTLDHLQAQAQEQMASVSGIPLVVLLGITPSGLNASSDGEVRTFFSYIESQQEQFYTPHLNRILEIIQLSELGEIDPGITFKFNPLWQLDEEKSAAVRKQNADTAIEYINAGVLSPLEERTRIAADEGSLYPSLDVNDLPEPPGDPGMGDPGMGGDPDAPPDDDVDPGESGPPGRQPPPGRQAPGREPPHGRQPPGRQPPGRAAPGRQPPAGRDATGRSNVVPFRGAHDDAGYEHWWHDTQHGGPIEVTVRLLPPVMGGGGGGLPDADPDLNPGIDPVVGIDPGDEPAEDEFKEADHPRGQPGNAGEFGPGGGGGASVKPKAPTQRASGAKPGEGAAHTEAKTATLSPTKVVGGKRVQANGAPLPPHIASLAIPPAWVGVRFNPDQNGNVLVTGKDSKNRPVQIQSKAYAASQSAKKYARVKALAEVYGQIAARNDAARRDLRTHDVADCLALVMATGIRPGSERDTGAATQGYGATTLQGSHVISTQQGVKLRFVPGKKHGQTIEMPIDDASVAKMLLKRKAAAGAKGKLFGAVTDKTLLAHTKSMAGNTFKTKDLRTHVGTQTAMRLVNSMPPPTDAKAYKQSVLQVAKAVSAKLGNTPVIALQSYIAPEVFGAWKMAA